jgi:hypothetical protein
MAQRTIQVGDSFLRSGAHGMVWVVEQIFEHDGLPPHAQLIERISGRIVTFSTSVLIGEQNFRLIAPKSE